MPRLKDGNNVRKPDYLILFLVFILVSFGLIMLSSASSDLGKIKFGDSYYYLKHQILLGLIPGLIGFLLASNFYYQRYKKWSVFLLLASISFLILIFSPMGVSAGGAHRWLKLGPLVFQPAELLKITFIIYIAAWLSGDERRRTGFWSGYMPFLFVCGIISFLLLIQPSTSAVAILMFSALAIYFISGARISYILGTVLIGTLIFLAVSYATPYRWQRIMNFVDPGQNIQGTGYHLNQALIAIGSGNIFGVGFGQSTTKIHYLPEPIGDSIFAVIAEEFGFVGSVSVILIFMFLVVRIFVLSRKCPDKFGQLILAGFGSLIGLQAFVNIGSISGFLPLTGTPLPFVSYGGTALAIFLIISGIIVNISRHN